MKRKALIDFVSIGANLVVVIGVVTYFIDAVNEQEALKQQNTLRMQANFLHCTQRFTELQSLLLTDPELAAFGVEISGSGASADFMISGDSSTPVGFLPKESPSQGMKRANREIAICSFMFQLMEDVWLTHQPEKQNRSVDFEGWYHIFHDWFQSWSVRRRWQELKMHYGIEFYRYVDRVYMQ